MLKETTHFSNRNSEKASENINSNSRLPAVDELTLGLKQKLHLKARTRVAPYYIKNKISEPVDLVDRLLEERALVAEAVRRLQALQQQCEDEDGKSRRSCNLKS